MEGSLLLYLHFTVSEFGVGRAGVARRRMSFKRLRWPLDMRPGPEGEQGRSRVDP